MQLFTQLINYHFIIFKVNMRVEPSYKGINASALLFVDVHDDLQSMLIICGTARNFKNIPVTKSWQAVFKLLSVYYVFDRNYPALYGVLSVIERRCISQQQDNKPLNLKQ